ncbi:MAG: hypothetical protein ACYSUS_09895 [Planctomycetota bacterium]|jgi:hypothetical protein
MRLNVKAFALACGLIWGLGLFCMAWWLILLEGNNVGSLVGMVWGLVDAGIGGAIFAWLYNLMSKKCTKSE